MAGDTVRVVGSNFGSEAAGSAVRFTSATRDVEAEIVSWTASRIDVLVPSSAIDGPVQAVIGETSSNGVDFSVADSLISLDRDVRPVFETFTCIVCHATTNPGGGYRIGNSQLQIDYPAMFTTGVRPPNIVARNSSESLLIRRLLPSTTIPLRMPQDGFPRYLNSAEILLISDWIDQGARNN